MWEVGEDFFFTGSSFNTSVNLFVEYLIRYALWLERSTDAVVLGFYTFHSEEPLADLQSLIATSEKDKSFNMITSAFQMNTTVWIKFYIPFAGDSTANVDAHFKSVKMIVNMHYINDGNSLITSLNPIHSFEDIVRVFFSKDEYLLWERAAPSPHLEPRYLEKLHT